MTTDIVETYSEEQQQQQDYSSETGPTIFGTAPAGKVGDTRPRAVVRIERDYSARGATSGRVQFWDGWVKELEGRVSLPAPLSLPLVSRGLTSFLPVLLDQPPATPEYPQRLQPHSRIRIRPLFLHPRQHPRRPLAIHLALAARNPS